MRNLVLLFTAFFLMATNLLAQEDLSAIGEYEKWDKVEYQKMLEKYVKVYIYPDGTYLKTHRLLKRSPKVAALLLSNRPTKLNGDQKGKLPKEMIKKIISQLEPYDPVKVVATLPCCPVYDREGRVLYSTWPPASCPSDCFRWIRIRNKNYKFSCCPLAQLRNWDIL